MDFRRSIADTTYMRNATNNSNTKAKTMSHSKRTDEFNDEPELAHCPELHARATADFCPLCNNLRFIAIMRDGEIKDNSGISWDWQVKSGDYGDVVAGVSLKAEFDGFGYVSQVWYGDESHEDEIKNSELYGSIITAIQDNEIN